jgi:heterodisulfide reductase subunit B
LVKTDSDSAEYVFFPGCLARVKLPQIERSVRLVLTRLGVGLRDEPRQTCCPDPVVFRSASRKDWLNIAARNLSLDSSLPIVTLCPGCASSLSEARHILESDDLLRKDVSDGLAKLGLTIGAPPVLHFLRLLSSEDFMQRLRGEITSRFENLKVACHYGCHLVRPSPAVQFDDPEKPICMDNIVGLLGAESLDYPDKYMCCGRPSMDESTSMAIAEHKLNSMKEVGCDLLVVACPFCFEQFDLGQVMIGRKTGRQLEIPVLYITQLLGLAMGASPADLGFDLHRISPKAFC